MQQQVLRRRPCSGRSANTAPARATPPDGAGASASAPPAAPPPAAPTTSASGANLADSGVELLMPTAYTAATDVRSRPLPLAGAGAGGGSGGGPPDPLQMLVQGRAQAQAVSATLRKTKLVCTIGPPTASREAIFKLADAGEGEREGERGGEGGGGDREREDGGATAAGPV